MIEVLIDPDIFFIDQKIWNNKHKKIEFIDFLTNHLEKINKINVINFFWCDELDEILLYNLNLTPWIQDNEWNNKIFPIYFTFFKPRLKYVDINNIKQCNAIPMMYFANNELKDKFMRLSHILLHNNSVEYICLGLHNLNLSKIKFTCNCNVNELMPIIINSYNDWCRKLNIVKLFWPKTIEDKKLFSVGIDLYMEKNSMSNINEYFLTDEFISSIIPVRNRQEKIILSVAKRLTLTKQESFNDPHLKDEFVHKTGQYRFRVSKKTRIHYKFEHKIIFIKYYSEGEHDAGL